MRLSHKRKLRQTVNRSLYFVCDLTRRVNTDLFKMVSGYIQNVLFCRRGIEGVIDEDAFNGCDQLETISIPPGITKIGQRAFMDCTKLNELIIPEGVKEIGEYAFLGCTNLKQIVMPNSIECIYNDFYWMEAEIVCPENSYVHKRAVELGREVTFLAETTA